MTPRLAFTPRAQADIAEIWRYTIDRWGRDQATAYLRRIEEAASNIAHNPHQGRRCDEIRSGYFKQTVGSHVMFYRLGNRDVSIVRVLHQRMDFSRHI